MSDILISNLTNPTLLFFVLGIIAALLKSDLEIPPHTVKFISLYLLFSIGFKGGQALSHSHFDFEIGLSLFYGLALSSVIPLYLFFFLVKKFGVYQAGAVAATYGSVSAVTFVAATSFLEINSMNADGHMVAVMALMEAPAIIVAVLLIRKYDTEQSVGLSVGQAIKHSFTNGSVLMVLGSLLIGFVADTKQAEGIRPFTTDIFKGFLAIFLLEMGMVTAQRFAAFRKYGVLAIALGVCIPLVNGAIGTYLSHWITDSVANRFLFGILSGSASYIAVPAAMRLAVPKADPGLYIPMALGVTFPFNISLGMPIYFWIAKIS